MHIKNFRVSRSLTLLMTVTAMLAATAGTAGAVHWPFYGGDAGRSGYQPVNEMGVPVTNAWTTSEAPVKSPPIITTGGGSAANALVGYGIHSGQHWYSHQFLTSGAPLGPETGIDVQAGTVDPDTYGDPATRSSVAAADSSSANARGVTYVVHNDDNQEGSSSNAVGPLNNPAVDPRTGGDIAIAWIDQTTGQLIGDVGLGPVRPSTTAGREKANTINFRIRSSPVLGPANNAGQRSLYFIADRESVLVDPGQFPCTPGQNFETAPGAGGEITRGCAVNAGRRLFKVTIDNANTINATFDNDDITVVDVDSNATLVASPTLVNLTVPPPAPDAGSTKLYVAVAGAGNVKTYRADDLTAGPATNVSLGAETMTPAVPVGSTGAIPSLAPFLYTATRVNSSTDDDTNSDTTRVHKLTQNGAILEIKDATTDQSHDISGAPSPAMALTQEADALSTGRVIVNTARNVVSLNATDFREGTQFNFSNGAGAAGTTGFYRTAPAASGDLVFTQRDNGEQLVLDKITMDPYTGSAFTERAGQDHAQGNESIGQPSLSRGFALWSTADGTFAYQAGTPSLGNVVPQTYFTIDDQSITEGDDGTKTMTFTVTKSGPSAASVTATTANNTAAAGQDYEAAGPTTLAFAAGDTTKTFQVTILGDKADESDELFTVQLANATNNAVIADGQGTGVITDDDATPAEKTPPTPALLVSDNVVVETNSGTQNLVFTVSLTQASASNVTVAYGTRDDNAKAGADYNATGGTLTFTPGQTSKAVAVPVRGDTLPEQPERFLLILANASGASIGDGSGIGTIIDNEELPGPGGYKLPVLAPRALSATTKPTRDTKAPFRFTTTGRLTPPSGLSRAEACGIGGRLDVQVKAIRTTISTRRVSLKSNCTYTSTVSFKNRKRFSKSGVLTFTVRFRGNDRLKPIRAKQQNVRTK